MSFSILGLFQQYIMKSGTALPAWSYRDSREIYQTVKNLAKFVDCPTTSTKNLVNCLRNKDTETLLFWCDIVGVFIHVAELAWVPTNEPKNEPNAFLTDNPQNLLKEMKDLPFISGVLGNEAVFITNGKQAITIRKKLIIIYLYIYKTLSYNKK